MVKAPTKMRRSAQKKRTAGSEAKQHAETELAIIRHKRERGIFWAGIAAATGLGFITNMLAGLILQGLPKDQTTYVTFLLSVLVVFIIILYYIFNHSLKDLRENTILGFSESLGQNR